MKRHLIASAALLLLLIGCQEKTSTTVLEIIQTTDVHGNYFSQDLLNDCPSTGSLARVQSYVAHYRLQGEPVVLVDAGDLLQGQPAAYFYNYIDTLAPHVAMQILDYMQYDAFTVGNHDIETGHSVYDRLVREANFPFLAANAIRTQNPDDTLSMVSYFKPYTLVTKGDKKVAILGLITPELVHQLPEVLWSGIRFDDQVKTAKRYLPEILEAHPDLIIALIHSGAGPKDPALPYDPENVGYALAREIPELDLVLCGHDHRTYVDSIVHDDNHTTYLLNPGPNADAVAHATVVFGKNGEKAIRPRIVSMDTIAPQSLFVQNFTPHRNRVLDYVSKRVGHVTETMESRGAFFRPTPFVDLIHEVQLGLFPQAQVSITAPLAENTCIPKGDLVVGDLFRLYKYENRAYLMRLSGKELRGHLEESYDRLYHTMSGPDDPMLKINEKKRGGLYLPLAGPSFNFDTAAGIIYSVDLSKPRGQRVVISSMADGSAFSDDQTYLVVLNSYRGNGGGGLLTQGAGIPTDSIDSRRVAVSEYDIRYYLSEYLSKNDPYTPHTVSRWQFVPTQWMQTAIPRDSALLYKDFH